MRAGNGLFSNGEVVTRTLGEFDGFRLGWIHAWRLTRCERGGDEWQVVITSDFGSREDLRLVEIRFDGVFEVTGPDGWELDECEILESSTEHGTTYQASDQRGFFCGFRTAELEFAGRYAVDGSLEPEVGQRPRLLAERDALLAEFVGQARSADPSPAFETAPATPIADMAVFGVDDCIDLGLAPALARVTLGTPASPAEIVLGGVTDVVQPGVSSLFGATGVDLRGRGFERIAGSLHVGEGRPLMNYQRVLRIASRPWPVASAPTPVRTPPS